ncbi:MAG: hypothetical protein AUK47_04110 [Deltaproteobacteria bacterium CG2_30_63_29]|nr:MAG: hypothetical protein AUK47_04110 [Deltaproteobacteria bacterium CG2_30_63_29]PJB38509.1 MAG: hypothetical protein CO108_18900 [Deltaproteobacteria bacterium CG_4_9_14_3_um_filter_63_12]
MGEEMREQERMSRWVTNVGDWSARHSWGVLVVSLLATLALGFPASQLTHDDDVIRFLPAGDEQVVRFQEIGRRFHGLHIGIVGIEATDGDVLTLEGLRLLRGIAESLANVDGVSAVTSLTELPDLTEKVDAAGGSFSVLKDLVGNLPKDANSPEANAFVADVRSRVLNRDHLVGTLISADGAASIVLCQLDVDANTQQTADAIRAVVAEQMPQGGGFRAHFGGAPFIGSYAAEHTRADLARLSPWVCAVVVLIMVLTIRSATSVFIALGSVGIGIVWVMGALKLVGGSMTLVSSSLPVLLVALGSAYSVHLLTAILARLDQGLERRAAIRAALRAVGPPILAAGSTTTAGFASFTLMDVTPMREFGVLMSSATLLIVALTLILVPAAAARFSMKPRAEGRAPRWALKWMMGGARGVIRWRVAVSLIAGGALAASTIFALRVDTHTDLRTLFAKESEPLKAERFLDERFGGSLYLQVEVTGDIKSPLTLRQIDRMKAWMSGLQGVSTVQSLTDVVVLAAEGSTGERRVPVSRRTSASIAELVSSDASVSLLVDDDWEHTLIQVKLSDFDMSHAAELAATIERGLSAYVGRRVAVERTSIGEPQVATERAEVLEQLRDLLVAQGTPVELGSLAKLFDISSDGPINPEIESILRLNLFDDPIIELKEEAELGPIVREVSATLRRGGLDAASLDAILAPYKSEQEQADEEEELQRLVEGDAAAKVSEGVMFILEELAGIGQGNIRQEQTDAVLAMVPEEKRSEGLRHAVERTLWSMTDPVVFLPEAASGDLKVLEAVELSTLVSGYPLVYVGMNRSVYRNQLMSLLSSAILVFLALWFFFRRFGLALVSMVPAALTLVFTFALMGVFRIPMDVGTSMIAAIGLGVGIDYAVHLVWKHRVPSPENAEAVLEEALSATGWGIVVNALEVSAGLSLLAFGTIIPMRNFGLLTASAMLISAITTLLLVPALIRSLRPDAQTSPAPIVAAVPAHHE